MSTKTTNLRGSKLSTIHRGSVWQRAMNRQPGSRLASATSSTKFSKFLDFSNFLKFRSNFELSKKLAPDRTFPWYFHFSTFEHHLNTQYNISNNHATTKTNFPRYFYQKHIFHGQNVEPAVNRQPGFRRKLVEQITSFIILPQNFLHGELLKCKFPDPGVFDTNYR